MRKKKNEKYSIERIRKDNGAKLKELKKEK